jgi:hypothetical protein
MSVFGYSAKGWSSSELYVWLIPRRGQWIRRRSDTIDFPDSTTVRIRTELTIDLDEFVDKLSSTESEIKLPLLLRSRGVASTSTIYDESGAIVPRLNRLEEVRALSQGLGYAFDPPTLDKITCKIVSSLSPSRALVDDPPDENQRVAFSELIKNHYFISAKLPKDGPATRVLTIERFAPVLDDKSFVFITGDGHRDPTFRDRVLPWKSRHIRGLAVTVPIEDWASSSSYHLAVNAPSGCVVAPLYACNVSTKGVEHFVIRQKHDGKQGFLRAQLCRPLDCPEEKDAKEECLALDVGNTVPFSVRLSATIPETQSLPLKPAYSLKETNCVSAMIEPVHHGTMRMILGIVSALGVVSSAYEIMVMHEPKHELSSMALSFGIVILALLAMGAPLLITPLRDKLAERLMFFARSMFVVQGALVVVFVVGVNLFAAYVRDIGNVIPWILVGFSLVTPGLMGVHYLRLKRFTGIVSPTGSRSGRGARRSHFYAKCITVDPPLGACD